jgi:glucuronoarabinoxylan endo-1,4-beta-xylanase
MVDFMICSVQNIENKVMAPESFQFLYSYTDLILNDGQAATTLDINAGNNYGGTFADYTV